MTLNCVFYIVNIMTAEVNNDNKKKYMLIKENIIMINRWIVL